MYSSLRQHLYSLTQCHYFEIHLNVECVTPIYEPLLMSYGVAIPQFVNPFTHHFHYLTISNTVVMRIYIQVFVCTRAVISLG